MTIKMKPREHRSTHYAYQHIKENICETLKEQNIPDVSEDEVNDALEVLTESLKDNDFLKIWIEDEYRQSLLLLLLSELVFNNVWREEE